MQTSVKLTNENSKNIEETLSSNLDFIISESTEHVYIHNVFNSIIEIGQKAENEKPDSKLSHAEKQAGSPRCTKAPDRAQTIAHSAVMTPETGA